MPAMRDEPGPSSEPSPVPACPKGRPHEATRYYSRMPDTIPTEISDPTNARILAVSEDRIAGFLEDPFAEIARLSGVELPVVLERIRAMVASGTIRRVRQTLMAPHLAPGARAGSRWR